LFGQPLFCELNCDLYREMLVAAEQVGSTFHFPLSRADRFSPYVAKRLLPLLFRPAPPPWGSSQMPA
ncbi:hypothetical protein CEW92_02055, partial [Bacillaceae bacterium SAS-127]